MSGHAATSDLGWQHITRELMLARCSLYARIMKLPDTPVHVRMKDMLNAAAHINTGWTHHTITMFRVAISPVPPPTGHMTWQSMLPMATRNLRRLDEALRQAELSRNLTLPLYPKQGPTTKHQHALYELGMAFDKCKLFGGMRAGATIFPYSTKDCPACGHSTHNTGHILRSCKSTKQLLNIWLQQVAPSVGSGRMSLSEAQFIRSIFDLGSIPTKHDQRATVNYVWHATHAAIRSATCRRNGNSAS